MNKMCVIVAGKVNLRKKKLNLKVTKTEKRKRKSRGHS